MNGIAALKVAELHSCKVVYEVRGLWHFTRSIYEPHFIHTDLFTYLDGMEILCCKNANKVVTISESLKKYLIAKGVNSNKIYVIPNGVDTDYFYRRRESNKTLVNHYKISKSKIIFGYIGTLLEYEGLDILLNACNLLKEEVDFKCLIIGDGPAYSKLKALAKKMDLLDKVNFLGRVSHEKVPDYYSLLDIAVFPRKRNHLTELVPPLKHLEAMAMGIPTIVSNLLPLRESIIPDETSIVFKPNNFIDLKDKLLQLIDNSDQRRQLGENSIQYIAKYRNWNFLSKMYIKLYNEL